MVDFDNSVAGLTLGLAELHFFEEVQHTVAVAVTAVVADIVVRIAAERVADKLVRELSKDILVEPERPGRANKSVEQVE